MTEGKIKIMYRMKVMLVSLLAVFAVSSVVVSTASAALTGPWWKHIENSKQVKFVENKEQPLKASNAGLGNFKLKSKTVLLGTVLIECQKATSTGFLWNGALQGEDESLVIFEECEAKGSLTGVCKGVIVENSKVYSELMWKYRGEAKELTEAGGQQKIFDAFAPTEPPTEGKAKFTTITLPAGCTGAGNYIVTAVGTEATFVDQKPTSHQIVWGTAAQVEPQNEDVTKGFLTWNTPNVTKLHHQEKEIVAKLQFAGQPAELEGKLAVELNNSEVFGAFNQ
jgi:hypothetical protein